MINVTGGANDDRRHVQCQEFYLDTVSTTCGSGWVRSLPPSALTSYPPATAGGTDCIQVRLVILTHSVFRNYLFVEFDVLRNHDIGAIAIDRRISCALAHLFAQFLVG